MLLELRVQNLLLIEEARLELPGNPYLVDVIEAAKVDVTLWGARAD